jgi:hypothetical protein
MIGFGITNFCILLVVLGSNGRQVVAARNDASGIAIQFDCLPEGYKSTNVVSYRQKRKGGEGYLTIEDKLIDLKAHCKDGKLIDEKGREIRFFKFACYGNPPGDYEEIRQRELEELEKLQKKYCVIVLECDPRIS